MRDGQGESGKKDRKEPRRGWLWRDEVARGAAAGAFQQPSDFLFPRASLGCSLPSVFFGRFLYFTLHFGGTTIATFPHFSFLFFVQTPSNFRNQESAERKTPEGDERRYIYTQFAEESKTRNGCELSGIHGIYGITQHDD